MHFTVLTDTNPSGALAGEWGLSILIEEKGLRFLLDAGSSDLCIKNARLLGLDLGSVDAAVLSHAHYDHADGMDEFFRRNDHAPFYLREDCGEDCYDLEEGGRYKYIGIRRGLLKEYADRIVYVTGRFSPLPGVTLLPHTAPDLMAAGVKAHMYRQTPCCMVPDDFGHEQSLVFETEKGLVIFNSCSHAGAASIIEEVSATFPGQKVYAMLGGFHLYNKTEAEVRSFARKLEKADVERIFTGHCTGDVAFVILQEMLGAEKLQRFYVGLAAEL